MSSFDPVSLAGATKEEARSAAEREGLKFRVRKEDGRAFVGTCDYRRDRVNVEIESGKVVRAWLG